MVTVNILTVTHGNLSLQHSSTPLKSRKYCLGFDVAASGQGDLAVIYIDEAKGGQS